MKETAKLVGAALITLLLLAAILQGLVPAAQTTSTESGTADIIDGQQLGTGTNITGVEQTLGDSVELTGASAGVDAPVTSWDMQYFAACSWARTQRTTGQMAVLSISGEAVLTYNASGGRWVGWIYNTSSTHSYRVEASASTAPTAFTHVCLEHNGTDLNIYENATLIGSSPTGGENIATPPNASGWDGRLEELRVFDQTPTPSGYDRLYNTPVRGLPTVDTSVRLMFDVRDRPSDTVPAYFTGARATISGGTLVDGFAGESVSVQDVTLTSDGRAVATSDKLNGSVLFLRVQGGGSIVDQLTGTVTSVGGSAVTILIVGVLVIAAARLTDVLGGGGM